MYGIFQGSIDILFYRFDGIYRVSRMRGVQGLRLPLLQNSPIELESSLIYLSLNELESALIEFQMSQIELKSSPFEL